MEEALILQVIQPQGSEAPGLQPQPQWPHPGTLTVVKYIVSHWALGSSQARSDPFLVLRSLCWNSNCFHRAELVQNTVKPKLPLPGEDDVVVQLK